MIDESKLQRLMELKLQRETIDAEITGLMGGEPAKRKWTRRAETAVEPQQEKSPI